MRHLDSYHGHRAEYPTPGQAWATVIGIVMAATAFIMVLCVLVLT